MRVAGSVRRSAGRWLARLPKRYRVWRRQLETIRAVDLAACDGSALEHDQSDALVVAQHADVRERVAIYDQEIGPCAGRERTYVASFSEDACCRACRRLDCLHRRQSRADQQFDFPRVPAVRIAVADIGARTERDVGL